MFGLICEESAAIARRRLRRLYDFVIVFLIWGSHVNLVSKVTPKNSASGTVVTGSPNNWIVG